MICLASFFILGFATTWGPMIWTICGELYPSRYRAKGMALSTASNWLWNFLLAFFTPFITSAIDFRYGYVFAACNFLGGLLVFFFVIEGQGRTLEEIDTMYIEKVIPWKSNKWTAPPPPPHEIARIRRQAGTHEEAVGDQDAGREATWGSEHSMNEDVSEADGDPQEKSKDDTDASEPEANGNEQTEKET